MILPFQWHDDGDKTDFVNEKHRHFSRYICQLDLGTQAAAGKPKKMQEELGVFLQWRNNKTKRMDQGPSVRWGLPPTANFPSGTQAAPVVLVGRQYPYCLQYLLYDANLLHKTYPERRKAVPYVRYYPVEKRNLTYISGQAATVVLVGRLKT